MEKFKDWFYNYSDIFTGLLITGVAGAIIFGSVTQIMSFSDSFHVLAEGKKNNSGPVIYGSSSTSAVDVIQNENAKGDDSASEGGIQTPPANSTGTAVTPSTSSTPTSSSVTSGTTPSSGSTGANTVRKRINIEIPSGSTASKVAQLLKDQGLISDTNDFLSVLTSSKLDSKLRSGSFTIPEGSNVTEIINILTGK